MAYYTGSTATGSPTSAAPIYVGTYTVVASFAGSASYDPADSAPVTFTITANPHTPTASDFGNAPVLHGHGVPVDLSVHVASPDNHALIITIVQGPSHGALGFVSPGHYNYVADNSYVGADSFTFKANDGPLESNIATATLGVTDHAPVALNFSASVLHGGTIDINLGANATDVDNDALTYTIVTPPIHGTLTYASPGHYTYVASNNYAGPDLIAFKANDGALFSNVATVSITVLDNPTITLAALVLSGHQVQLTGTVTSAHAQGVLVTFSGAVAGTALTDASGNFTYTTSNASLGTVSAVGTNDLQHTTNMASTQVAEAKPAVALVIDDMTATTVTFKGVLADVDTAGQTLSIAGASATSVTTDANGNFTFTADRAGLCLVDVSDSDLWGQTGLAEVDVTHAAPLIRAFTAIKGDANCWIFQGRVAGNDVVGLTVDFGGLPDLVNKTALVESDSWFHLTLFLPADETGTATAQTTQNGQNSNVAFAEVVP